MERKASIHKVSRNTEKTAVRNGAFNTQEVVNVNIMRKETISTSSLSFALSNDPEMLQRVRSELQLAIRKINEILEQINSYRVDRDWSELIVKNRTKLSRYSLMQSDCYWANMDCDLSQALVTLEECKETLLPKFRENLRMSDLIYMVKVLESVKEEFERKLEQIEDVMS